MPLGVLTHPQLPSGWQCWPPKVSLRGAQVMGYKKPRGASVFCLLPLCEIGMNNFKGLENSDMEEL